MGVSYLDRLGPKMVKVEGQILTKSKIQLYLAFDTIVSCFLVSFGPRWGPFWAHLGSLVAHFGDFGARFGRPRPSIWRCSGLPGLKIDVIITNHD